MTNQNHKKPTVYPGGAQNPENLSHGVKHSINTILKKLSESTSLSHEEREKLSHVVSEYVSLKPLPEEKDGANVTRVHSPFSPHFFLGKPVAFVLIFGVLVSGGGVSYAAERAVPGDALYPIKVSVNEEVRAAFADTPEEKASWEATRAERRLEEAAKLAVLGRLDDTKRAVIEKQFAKHADRATVGVEGLQAVDNPIAVDLAANFEARLSAHIAVLDEFDAPHKLVVSAIRAKVERLGTIRRAAEGRIAILEIDNDTVRSSVTNIVPSLMFESSSEVLPEPSPEDQATDFAVEVGVTPDSDEGRELAVRMKNVAEMAHAEASLALSRALKRLVENDHARAEDMLNDSEKYLREAAYAFTEERFTEAVHLYQGSLSASRQVIVSLKAALRLDIRIAPRQQREQLLEIPEITKPTDSFLTPDLKL